MVFVGLHLQPLYLSYLQQVLGRYGGKGIFISFLCFILSFFLGLMYFFFILFDSHKSITTRLELQSVLSMSLKSYELSATI